MKNMKYMIAAAFAALLLAGCSDASAKLKNADEVVMTVGSAKITKGEIYNAMAISSGGSEIAADAKKVIAQAEIEITDEIKESAQSTLDLYSSLYGDSFATMLESSGMTQDEYLNDYLIPSLQGEKLVNKYIDEHFDEIAAAYDPVQATILTFTSKADADAALSALRDGSKTPAVAASDNNSSSTGNPEIVTVNTSSYDTSVLSVVRSGSPDDGWVLLPGMDGSSFYLIRIESHNPADYKEEAIQSLSNISAISTNANDYFFRKYNFRVYDIDMYKQLKESNPNILVQDKAAPTPFPAASTPAPVTTPDTTAAPASTAEATAAPEAAAEAEATVSPEATADAKATASPEAAEDAKATASPEATADAKATASPEATADAKATASPEAAADTKTSKN